MITLNAPTSRMMIITMITISIAGVSSGLFWYFTKNDDIASDQLPKKETWSGVRPELNQSLVLSRTDYNRSEEGRREYVTKLTNILENQKDLSQYERRVITLARAWAMPGQYLLSFSDERKNATVYAYNDFYNLYTSILPGEENVSTLKTRTIVELYDTFENSCFLKDWFNLSLWKDHPLVTQAIAKYPNNKHLAYFVFSEDLFSQSGLMVDKISLGYHINVLSRLLDSFEDQLTQEDKTRYSKKLALLMKEFPSKESSLLGVANQQSKAFYFIDAKNYAYGLQVLSKYDKSITKEMVIANYEKTLSEFDALLKERNNYMVDSSIKNYILFVYSGYLFELGGETHKQKSKQLVNYLIENDNMPKEMSAGRSFFLMNAQTDIASWDKIRQRTIKIAKEYEPLKVFLQSKNLVID